MAKNSYFTREEMSRLQTIALEEFQELADRLAPLLERITADPADPALYKDILIIFHTIGGSAGLAGFPAISRFGLEIEAFVKKITNGQTAPDSAATEKIRAAREQLHALMKNPH